jgi:hypothetical protein
MPEFIVSGPQTSSASHGEFRALTIFRKSQYGIVSVRVIQKDIYERTQDPNDELYHAKYVERQRELGN